MAFTSAHFQRLFSVSCRLAAAVAVLSAAGCGDEAAVAGPSVVDDDATGGGGGDAGLTGDAALAEDGAQSTDTGGSVLDVFVVDKDTAVGGEDSSGGADAAGGSDGTIAPPDASGGGSGATSCAGKCGVYDKAAQCQCDDQCTANGDCCGDYQAQCGAVAKTCGDGKCVAPEDKSNCPGDCGTITPPGSCSGKCGQYDKTWTCQCDTKCAQNNDCCGDYTSACQGGGGTGGIVTCVETNCASQVATCSADAKCKAVLDCAKNCSDQQCLFGCVQQGGGGFQLPNGLQAVYDCGNQNKCFSTGGGTTPTCNNNGTCDAGETTQNCPADCSGGTTSANSCAGKCGQLNTSGGWQACQCQSWCVQAGNCCADYQTLCGSGGTTPTCNNNGTCDAGETNANCPKDCPAGGGGGTTADQCLASACSKNYTDCQASAACKAAIPCMESGKQVWQCITNGADWQAGLTLGQLQACGTQNKCL